MSMNRKIKGIIIVVATSILLTPGRAAKGDFVFGTPTNMGAPFNSSSDDGTYSFSQDGLELYLASNRPGGYGHYDLYVMARESLDAEWAEPVNLGTMINSPEYDSMPCISPDGLELYFNSGSTPTPDLWVAKRTTVDDAWGLAVNLGPTVNSSHWEQHPTLSSDGLTLIFESSRPGGHGGSDLWVTTRASTGDAWSNPTNIGPTVNTPYNEWWPRFSPDDRMLFFTSNNRPGGFGKTDLWISRRATTEDAWSVPINIGPALNTPDDEGAPTFSLDGSVLYFASDRPGGLGGWDQWQVSIDPVVDLNVDEIVDCADVSEMIDFWGTDNTLYDIGPMPWGDGVVDAQDLLVLAEYMVNNPVDVNDIQLTIDN
ncbi:MAG: PD40 domain-containing protein [Phycisphaerales bacterium]|nr:MAG: PD40 domain-containing protein [Phycisphaerales bacterium]